MSPIAAKGEDKLVGFYIYLYNVFFLCLFVCAAFFCGVTRGVTESKRFAYLSMLMALLALEGVADMGSPLVSGTFSSGGSFGPHGALTLFGIAKTLSQMGEEILFYLLACDVTKRAARSALFLLFPVLALVRCLAGTVYLGIVSDMVFLFIDPLVMISLCAWSLMGLAHSAPVEDADSRALHLLRSLLLLCLCAYAASIGEDLIYAAMYMRSGSVPFYVGKIVIMEDALWAGLAISCIIYARHYQDEFHVRRTEQLVRDRLDLYRLETEQRAAKQGADDIADFCALYELTPREQEVLSRVLTGQGNQQIANDLVISLGTVKAHVHSIYRKLSVSRRSELMGMFYERSRGAAAPAEK